MTLGDPVQINRRAQHPHHVRLSVEAGRSTPMRAGCPRQAPTLALFGGIECLKRATRSQADVGNRTRDLSLTMRVLYQLSYVGTGSDRIL